MTDNFAHQHTAHCETGVMSTLLKHHELDISEPMALGLGSGISYAYIPIIKLNGLPLITYRMPPNTIINNLRKQLKLKLKFQKFSQPEQGMRALDTQLDQGNIVGLQTSVFWLPYFPPEMRFHFNGHNLIAYGKANGEYLISDPVVEVPVTCPPADLQKARFTKGALAPKGMMYYLDQKPDSINLENLIPKAIRRSCRIMHAPLPFAGIRGMRYVAKLLKKLDKKIPDPHKMGLFIGHMVRMQEEIGTGGAGFRFIYAAFLQEAAELTNQSLLSDASKMMTDAGDQWRMFALMAAKMCKARMEMNLQQLSDQLLKCSNEEAKVWDLLKKYS